MRRAEMSEWSNEHDWKSCDVKASAGSNPVLCAINELYEPEVRTFLSSKFLCHLPKNMLK